MTDTRTILVLEVECEHGRPRPHRQPNASRMCEGGERRVWSDTQHLVMKNGFVFTVADVLTAMRKQMEKEVDLFAKVSRGT